MENPFSKNQLLLLGAAVIALVLSVYFVFFTQSGKSTGFSEKKVYTVAVDSSWHPLMLLGRESNVLGFTTELLQEIEKEEHFKTHIIERDTSHLRNGLEDKQYDAMISALGPNDLLKHYYIFSDPIYKFGPVLVVRSDSKIARPQDLKGKVIGITPDEGELFLQYPSLYVVTYPTMNAALDKLVDDEIDAVMLEAIPAYVMAQGPYQGEIKIITAPLTNQGLRLVTLKEPKYQTLINRFDEGLKKVKEDGTYGKLIKRWGLINPEIK